MLTITIGGEQVEIDLDKTSLTNLDLTNPVTKDGTFDLLVKSSLELLEQQFIQQAISKTEIATVVPAIINAAMQNAVAFLLGRDQAYFNNLLLLKQIELADAKIETEYAQTHDYDKNGNEITGLIGSQIKVSKAQEYAIHRDLEIKFANIYINSYTVRKGIDEATKTPSSIDTGNTDTVFKTVGDNLGIPIDLTIKE